MKKWILNIPLLALSLALGAEAAKPNVILIFIDDMAMGTSGRLETRSTRLRTWIEWLRKAIGSPISTYPTPIARHPGRPS